MRLNSRRMWMLGVLALLALGIGAYAFILYGSPEAAREQPFATDKGKLPEVWHSMLWLHAVSAGAALAIGWLQFLPALRKQGAGVHRMIGYLYSALIIVGGLTGLYLAVYANGGWSAHIGFGALAIAWLFTLYRGLRSMIVDRDPRGHGRWMIRNYALTCAAITLRLYTGIADGVFGWTDTNETFVIIAWLAWVPNLIVAEWGIIRRSSQRPVAGKVALRR